MSKLLTLRDGTEITLTETATIYEATTVVKKFADIDELRPLFTEENLSGATLDDEEYFDVLPVGVKAEADVEGNIVAIFVNRDKTKDEKQDSQILETQSAVSEIIENL